MNTEQQRQQAEQERNVDENRRQVAEKQREVGEQLRGIERSGERLVVEYSTRSLLARIEGFEEQIARLSSRLESVEALLKVMQGQLQQLGNSNT